MLRDIWEQYGDYNIIRRFRLLCRATAAEFRPLPAEIWSHGRTVGAFGVELLHQHLIFSGKIIRVWRYLHRGTLMAAHLHDYAGRCARVAANAPYAGIFDTTAENLLYLNSAIFPRQTGNYYDYTPVGTGTELYIFVPGRPLPPGMVGWDDQIQDTPDGHYMMMFHDGYGPRPGIFAISGTAPYLKYALWKVTLFTSVP